MGHSYRTFSFFGALGGVLLLLLAVLALLLLLALLFLLYEWDRRVWHTIVISIVMNMGMMMKSRSCRSLVEICCWSLGSAATGTLRLCVSSDYFDMRWIIKVKIIMVMMMVMILKKSRSLAQILCCCWNLTLRYYFIQGHTNTSH
jgi:hypothetical protein